MNTMAGSIVALVTPMQADGSVDYPALKRLIDWHIAQGTQVLGVTGTTGESATLGADFERVVRTAVEHTAGRVPVLAGAGTNDTAHAVALTRLCHSAGADAVLSVAPYYNKPSQEGMFQHFKAVAESCPVPVMLYNVPSRTVADLAHDTVLRLAELPNVFGLKDATGDLERGAWLLKDLPASFSLYSGDDATAAALMLLGAKGVVSVAANVAPAAVRALCDAALAGDARRTAPLNARLLALHRALFCEPSPAPTKWALAEIGLCSPALRLPLLPLSPAAAAQVRSAMQAAGVQPL